MFRRGRGLRTSFNSTLLWKLQLPLSRLAPRLLLPLLQLRLPHQPYPLASNPGRVQASSQVGFTFRGATKPSCACLSTCAHVRLICKTFNMHEKGTLKHLVKTKKKKKTMRDQTSTYFYLFIIRITLKSTEKLGRLGREGEGDGWRRVGGVKHRSRDR